MPKITITLLLCLLVFSAHSQAIYETVFSEKLGEERQIKIQLPRGYDAEDKQKYPVILVLDGDYLFEAVAGNVDYYSYWQDMPNAIVVGVNQATSRFEDCFYSEINSLPEKTGVSFFEFISMELMPYVWKNFNTEDFSVAVGHGVTANFINYYLLKPHPLFQAYVVFSPDLAPKMPSYISEKLKKIEQKTFYYLATSEDDEQHLKEATEALDKNLASLENKSLFYKYDKFKQASHYAVPVYAMAKALDAIFLVYQPISKKEYRETLLKIEDPVAYLAEKYETIEALFGIEKQILVNDFRAVATAIERTQKFELYEELAKMAQKQYPETLLGNYYTARFYEETGKPKKAMKTYHSAFIKEEIAGITKDMALQKAEAIKADFGY